MLGNNVNISAWDGLMLWHTLAMNTVPLALNQIALPS